MSHRPGAVLGGRYTLVDRIAGGGMGDVWRATDTVLGRPVAVKVLRTRTTDEERFAARFRDEARHAAALAHPNIAAVYDYGEDEGTAYLVMELVPGRPLSAIVADGPMPQAQARVVLGQCALALAAAHEAGVVHRDVKPANILLTPEGQVKLTDFGIARAADGATHTRTGEVMGTPHYLAPEQAMGRPVTGAADLYSLGVVGYELVTGRRPFDEESPVATALAHLHAEAPPLPASIGEPVRSAIESCLAKEPAHRPSSAAALAALLGMPVSGVAHASPATSVIPVTDLGATVAMDQLPLDPAAGIPTPRPAPTVPVPREDRTVAPWGPAAEVPAAGVSAAPAGGGEAAYGRRRGTWAWWLLPIAAVAAVAVALLWQSRTAPTPTTPTVTITRPGPTTPAPPTTAPSVPPTVPPTVATVTLRSADYVGQTVGIVRSDLTTLGFLDVRTREVFSDRPVGTVVGVDPSGVVRVDQPVTLSVSKGPEPAPPPATPPATPPGTPGATTGTAGRRARKPGSGGGGS